MSIHVHVVVFWLPFLTSLCAIIGGVYSVTGLLDGAVFHSSNALRRKMEIGKAA